jgi:hypothetical protein
VAALLDTIRKENPGRVLESTIDNLLLQRRKGVRFCE